MNEFEYKFFISGGLENSEEMSIYAEKGMMGQWTLLRERLMAFYKLAACDIPPYNSTF
jgi:hypothetical protein